MKTPKHLYYVRTAKQNNQHEPLWSKWFGPIVAYGPYTAALHFATKHNTQKTRVRIITQVISDSDETIEITFRLNKICTNPERTQRKPNKKNRTDGPL